MAILFTIGRVIFGLYFIINAYNHLVGYKNMSGYAAMKGVPMPKLAVIVSGLLLLAGGAGILLGMWIKIALICLIIFMVFVTPMMHAFWKETDPMKKMSERVAFMKNMAILGALLMMVAPFIVL